MLYKKIKEKININLNTNKKIKFFKKVLIFLINTFLYFFQNIYK
jgi:hypothetical protein